MEGEFQSDQVGKKNIMSLDLFLCHLGSLVMICSILSVCKKLTFNEDTIVIKNIVL